MDLDGDVAGIEHPSVPETNRRLLKLVIARELESELGIALRVVTVGLDRLRLGRERLVDFTVAGLTIGKVPKNFGIESLTRAPPATRREDAAL